ncbi:hypothetical protein [Pseudovibrio brasiliensis]|uniref:Uncharacterized protein n=1 Tax=Pseudovibrio brasiliensis TaxID=1898042 RepID=A0ABX8AJW1_9HYPH|nr:hypothetical protein [Pseudovibrio brasiliensis]QUS54031.1 hypothetical protein KGB56_11330 [Pseudovibrio brasiliensis]
MFLALALLGLLLLVAGIISIIVPLKFIGISSRKKALIPLLAGFVVLGVASSQLDTEHNQAAQEAGFDSVKDYKHAKELGISSPEEYAPIKAKALAEEKAKAEAIAKAEAEREKEERAKQLALDTQKAKDAGFASVEEYEAAKNAGFDTADAYAEHMKKEAFFAIPAEQTQFVAAVQKATESYRAAKNELAQGGTRSKRKENVCAVLSSLEVQNWVGQLEQLTSNSDGLGVISVRLADGVTVKTWNNAFSDIGDNTLIEPSSALFSKVAELDKNQRIRFSGRFFSSDLDCIKEPSISLRGSMTDPEYIMRFYNIETP